MTDNYACYNPKCKHHHYMSPSINPAYFIVASLGGDFRVLRHLYRDVNGDAIYFCDVCHTAIQMITDTDGDPM